MLSGVIFAGAAGKTQKTWISFFFLAAPAKMTPESIEHYTKQFKYLSKTFLPIFQKFCLFWPQTLQEPKTFQKNPTGQADLQKKPTSHFNFVSNFFPFCLALLNRMPRYRKVQMGKRRRHGWMHEGSKIMRIIFWIVLDEISWTTFLWCPQFFFSPKNGFFLLQNCLFGKKVTDWIKLEYMMKTFSAIFCKKKFCEYHKYRRIFFFCTGPP